MGFSKKVKEEILVDTARCCCVCHRYKGVKVEVHHILQEALGGENTYENAITLCFDCHADAGHYNIQHPRGTKFSLSELKKAKEKWLDIVKQNNIQVSAEPDQFLCQYFVCENFEILWEISNSDLSAFPIKQPLLVKNEVFDCLKLLISSHPSRFRAGSAWGKEYSNQKEYIKKYPNSQISSQSKPDSRFPYFEVLRTPKLEEIEKFEDGILKFMINQRMPVENVLSIVGGYENKCGDVVFQEEYIFRKVWGSFLAIKNISDRPLALASLIGEATFKREFMPYSTLNNDSTVVDLPKMPIEQNNTVLIPLSIILPPLYPLYRQEWSLHSQKGNGEQVQTITRVSISSKNINDCLSFGGQIYPTKIKYKLDGNIYCQDIHAFDLSCLYSIDKHFQCGSCPHLFFVKEEEIYYGRELLSHCNSKIGIDNFTIPSEVHSIVIAEIEYEITEINWIKIDNKVYARNIKLHKSEFLRIPVLQNSIVEIKGRYIQNSVVDEISPTGIVRNNLVNQFFKNLTRNRSLY